MNVKAHNFVLVLKLADDVISGKEDRGDFFLEAGLSNFQINQDFFFFFFFLIHI